MPLTIKRIVLDDLRGYDHLVIDDLSNLVIIVGPNAVGKTNIIEAVHLLTAGMSFRKPSWKDVVSFGCETGYATIELEEDKRRLEHKLVITGNERRYEVNSKKKTPSAIRGTLPSIVFTPDDLQLIKASSSVRRDAVDALAIQLSKEYSTLKKEYQQALRQRNQLIKDGVHEGFLFDSWDESAAVHGARLTLSRWRLFDRLATHMASIHEEVVPNERLEAKYLPSWLRDGSSSKNIDDISMMDDVPGSSHMDLDSIKNEMLGFSRENKDAELNRGLSLVGPQRDEMVFFINGKNAKNFASQGQQRTITLIMKLAEVELVREIVGTKPVLLLDDVMSELDGRHRKTLMEVIEQNTQTFITTTNLDYFTADVLDGATVVEVPIKGTKYDE